MITASDLWAPAGLVVTAGDLTLTPITDDDLPGLVELVLSGIHDADRMPFVVPWTRTPREDVPRRFAQHHWEVRAAFSPEHFSLDLAVRRSSELVGTQGCTGIDYPVTRTVETGSWLAQRYQGAGIGTRMRKAVCTLVFDHLGAAEVTSTAFLDNSASLAVSRKVGYRTGDVVRVSREGALASSQRLRLGPDDLVRGEPVQVSGVEPLRALLGLA